MAMTKTLLFVGVFSVVLSMALIPFLQSSADAQQYLRTHITSRFDKTAVCGDHYCTAGEYEQWKSGVVSGQRTSQGKMIPGMTGANVMNNMTGTPQSSTGMHGPGNIGYRNYTQEVSTPTKSVAPPPLCDSINALLIGSGMSDSVIAKVLADLGCS